MGNPDLSIEARLCGTPSGGIACLLCTPLFFVLHPFCTILFAYTCRIAEPSPVLRIDMLGDKVVLGSIWDVWTAGVAIDTLCVQKGKQGYAFGIGE